jgi:ABC-type lipoprotein release transport system permease subunit
LASLLALPLGEPGGMAILQSFTTRYSMEILPGGVNLSVYIAALIAGPVTVILSAYFPIRKIAGYEPIRAIRGWMMEKGYVGETFLEKIGKKLGVQGYGFKFVVRGMSLNKARASLMIIGIGLAAAVASMGTIMVTGFNRSIAVYMEQYEHWDILVDFKQPMNSTEIEELVEQVDGIASYEPYLKLGTNAIISDTPRIVSLLCLNTTGRLHEFNLESGRSLENTHEALVDVTISNMLGIGRGDTINFTIGDSFRIFTIVGVVSSPMNVFYISLSEITEILGREMIGGLFVEIEDGSDSTSVADLIFGQDEVENSMTISEATSGVISEEQGIAVAIGMAGIAMALLLAVVWNIVSISVGEKIPELAQLEAIGWSRNTLTRLLFIELFLVTMFGLVLSVPFSLTISTFFDEFMKTFIPFYVSSFDIMAFGLVTVITIFTTILASLPAVRKLRRIVVDDVIRDRLMT